MRNYLLIAVFSSIAACGSNQASESSQDMTAGLSESAAPKAALAFLGNPTCSVSGHEVDQDEFVEHDGQRAYFCCAKCTAAAQADPAAAIAAAYPQATLVGNVACPVSGKPVKGSKTGTWQGHTVGICCGHCVAEFASDPGNYTKIAMQGK